MAAHSEALLAIRDELNSRLLGAGIKTISVKSAPADNRLEVTLTSFKFEKILIHILESSTGLHAWNAANVVCFSEKDNYCDWNDENAVEKLLVSILIACYGHHDDSACDFLLIPGVWSKMFKR